MNYSRDINRVAIGRRVLRSWLIVLVIGLALGFGIGFAVRALTAGHPEAEETKDVSEFTEAEKLETQIERLETVLYGSPDGRESVIDSEYGWTYGAADFGPLDVDMSADMQEYVFYISRAYNIDWTFVMAIIQQESNYKPYTISNTGDYGLMQINICNHECLTEKLGITDFLDPYQNVWAGCYILHGLFEKYDDANRVLMAYNLGETGASILWNRGICETNYTRSVLKIQEELEEMAK